jgi:hypothetical protein
MKLKCSTCGTTFDSENNSVVQKLHDDHMEKFHGNKQEQIKTALTISKSFAFQIANGAVPSRKKARDLVAMASMLLDEPIPRMQDDEKTPVEKPVVNLGGEAPATVTQGTTGETSKSKK